MQENKDRNPSVIVDRETLAEQMVNVGISPDVGSGFALMTNLFFRPERWRDG